MKDAFSVSEENGYTPEFNNNVVRNMDVDLKTEGGASVSTQHSKASSLRNAVVQSALDGLGGEYVWGGSSWKAWDCSGFVQCVYHTAGIPIPRVHQWLAANPVKEPQLGDLVVQNGGTHVGIYIGNNEMVSSLNPSQGTIQHPVNWMTTDGYYTFL